MTTTTKAWIHGLVAAGIGAIATAASGVLALPTVFNFTHDGLMNVLKLTMVPTLLQVFAYLKQSPLPGAVIEPGDKASIQNPTIAPDGTITGTSATLQKKDDSK